LSPSFEKLIEAQGKIVGISGPDSPLDGLRTDAKADADAVEVDTEPSVTPREPARPVSDAPAEPRVRSKAGRPPASKRIADELRAEYGVDTTL
jgi:eukaryotic-like serine/threonine-protein kinase